MAPAYWRPARPAQGTNFGSVLNVARALSGTERSSSSKETSGRNIPVAVALNRRQIDPKEEDEEKPVASPPGRDTDDAPPEAPSKDADATPQPEAPSPNTPTDEVEPKPDTEPPRPAQPTEDASKPDDPAAPTVPTRGPQPEGSPQPSTPSASDEVDVKPAPSADAPKPPVEAEPTPVPEPVATPAPIPTTTRRGGLLDGITGGLGDVIGGITSAIFPPAPATSEVAVPAPSEVVVPAPPPPPGRPGLGDVLDGIIPGPPILAPVTSIVGDILPTPPARPPLPPPPPPPVAPPPVPAPGGGGIISRILDGVLPSAVPVPNLPDLPDVVSAIIPGPPQPTPSAPVLAPIPTLVLPPILPSALPPVLPPVLPSRPAVVTPSALPTPNVPDFPGSIIPSPVPITVAPVQQPSRLPPVPSVILPGEDSDAPVVVTAPISNVPITSVTAALPSVTRVASSSVSSPVAVSSRAGVILAAQGENVETGAPAASASIEVTTTIDVTSLSTGSITSTLANGAKTTFVTTSTSVSQRTTVTTIPNPSGSPETVSATGSNSNPAVMGGAIGGALVILIGLLVAFFILRRRRRENVRFSGSFSPENGFGGSSEPKSYLTVPPSRHSPRERKGSLASSPQAIPEPDMSQTQVLGPAQYAYDFTLPSRNATENPFMDQHAQLKAPMVTVTPPGGEYVTPSPADPFAITPMLRPSTTTSENVRTLVAPANAGATEPTIAAQNPFADPVVLPPIQPSAPLVAPAMPKDQTDPFEDPSIPTKYIKYGKDDSKLGRYSVSTLATNKRDTLAAGKTGEDPKRASVASTAFTEDGKVMIDAM